MSTVVYIGNWENKKKEYARSIEYLNLSTTSSVSGDEFIDWRSHQRSQKSYLYLLEILCLDINYTILCTQNPRFGTAYHIPRHRGPTKRARYSMEDFLLLEVKLFFFKCRNLNIKMHDRLVGFHPITVTIFFSNLVHEIHEQMKSSDALEMTLRKDLEQFKCLITWHENITAISDSEKHRYLEDFVQILYAKKIDSEDIIYLFDIFERIYSEYLNRASVDLLDFLLSFLQRVKRDIFNICSNNTGNTIYIDSTFRSDNDGRNLSNEYNNFPHWFSPQDMLTGCILHKKFELVDRLIKYGALNPTMTNIIDYLQYIPTIRIRDQNFLRKPIDRREFLVLQATLYYTSHRSNISLLWLSIEDVFLTNDDFQDASKYFYYPTYYTTERTLRIIWEWYKKEIWGNNEVIRKPRSLQHYARCCIRKSLEKNFSVSHGIDELRLPPKVKQYLSLNMDEVRKMLH